MHLAKSNTYTTFVFILCFYFLLLTSCSSKENNRNKVSFKDSVGVVEDSLKLMSYYLEKIKDAEVKNFFFDREHYLFINNVKVARMSLGDKINFISDVQTITGLSEIESYKFVSLALFLRENYVTGCFKHRFFAVNFFNYRETLENNYEDQRYILIFDDNTKSLKGSEVESYQLIDRKGDLLLIAPADVKIK